MRILFQLLCAGGLLLSPALPGAETPPDAEEVELQRQRLRARVASDWALRYQVDITPDFWTTERDGITPAEDLQQRARAVAAEHLRLRETAVGAGLIADASFAAVERRRLLHATSAPLRTQGPSSFDKPELSRWQYYLYDHDQIRLALDRQKRAASASAAKAGADLPAE